MSTSFNDIPASSEVSCVSLYEEYDSIKHGSLFSSFISLICALSAAISYLAFYSAIDSSLSLPSDSWLLESYVDSCNSIIYASLSVNCLAYN